MWFYGLTTFILGLIAAKVGNRILDNTLTLHKETLIREEKETIGGYYMMGAKWKSPSEVQSLLFDRGRFSKAQAKNWARNNGYKWGDAHIDITENYIRIRQIPPAEFKTLRTINFKPGLKALIGPS